jgi:hypothetical protein
MPVIGYLVIQFLKKLINTITYCWLFLYFSIGLKESKERILLKPCIQNGKFAENLAITEKIIAISDKSLIVKYNIINISNRIRPIKHKEDII